MKKINKQQPSQEFTDFVKSKRPTDWKDCDGEVKRQAKEYILLEEQDLLCGYTEIYIDNEDCHIDHYVKRSLDNRLCFDWKNLIVAVNDEDFGAKYKDNGGNNIKSLAEYNDILNPVNDDGNDYFQYSLNGEINPIETLNSKGIDKSDNTIKVFNLNHNSLKTRRADLSKIIIGLRNGGLKDDEILGCLEKSGFYSFTNYILENY
ncbi:TIGR02646 family protein [Chryseobacterium sp. RP-3-3]|uniref:TIGR02646 family protein n=1 Tax=Chryseobacterium antibioticum TaxID=2728847 RepID=A0A7Y0FTR8_9FLAO|nr:retron system putative HNH endonuclease [Chryseobacterium antibioticum]NML72120.1 TIGR02646 family protein [Chryseobacterium antibioticum]